MRILELKESPNNATLARLSTSPWEWTYMFTYSDGRVSPNQCDLLERPIASDDTDYSFVDWLDQ